MIATLLIISIAAAFWGFLAYIVSCGVYRDAD